jgi:hypothetical protein
LLFVRRPERRRPSNFAVFFGTTREHDANFRSAEIDAYDDLVKLDLAAALDGSTPVGEPLDHPLFVVCTHGKRDPCCARAGRPLYDGLREAVEEDWVWQSTHVGGDRFAGNLVCFPEGVYYGRVERLDVFAVLAEHLAGRIDLEHYRGRCCYSFPVQAAEHEVRVRTGLRGIEDVRFTAIRRLGEDEWSVRLLAGGTSYEVEVAAELGAMTQLTCGSPAAKRPRRFVARSARSLPEPAA